MLLDEDLDPVEDAFQAEGELHLRRATRSPEAANGFTFVVMFLPYVSSTFVSIRTMPGWLQGFARSQPVTPVVESLRGLLLGRPVGASPWQALAWCGVILIVSVTAAAVLFRRRTG